MNIDVLKNILLGKYSKARLEAREIAKSQDLHYVPNLNLRNHRDRVLGQVTLLRDSGLVMKAFPKEYGGADDFGGHVAGFEELFVTDPSLQIKSGVQYGLFAAAVQHLGTKKHHDAYLEKILNLEMLGCYGMTESGHGSDVFNIKTTATYDVKNDEFIIQTPSRDAWKDYLGNAAMHGRWAVVFAQLYTGMNEKHGVHAFLVPIRDSKGNFLPGVSGEDDGAKGGLNGIDNGRLAFNNVRIPRDNLLNRYGDVNDRGEYSSPISNPKRRFFVMLGTLVQGRVSLDGAAVVASKVALQIGVTYANKRRQFMKASGEETLLMDYQTHQARLLPLLAETYAASFAHEKLLDEFNTVFERLAVSGGEEVEGMQDLETHAAVLKAVNTWHALNTLQQVREACGGNGFLQENHIVQMKSDFDIYVTFEGDNTVLSQLVGKRLLTDYSVKFREASATQKLQLASQDIVDMAKFKFTGLNHSHTISELLKARVDLMTAHIASELYKARKNDENLEEAFNKHQVEVVQLAKAYGDLVRFEAFKEAVRKLPNIEEWKPLNDLKKLFGFYVIHKDLGWFLMHNILTSNQGKEVDNIINNLYTSLRPHAQSFVDAFGYEPEHLRAKILD